MTENEWKTIERNMIAAFQDGNVDPETFGDCISMRDENAFTRINDELRKTGLDLLSYSDEDCCMATDLTKSQAT